MVDYRIDIIVNPNGAIDGTRRVRREFDGLDAKANQLRNTILGVFGGVVTGSLITSGVRQLAEFGEALATVRAVSGATGAEFERLKDRTLELGNTTRFTATAAASALLDLSRAGFSTDESLQAVGDTLVLATAGGINLASAADIAASALRGFRFQADEMGQVADVLAETANKTNTSVQELGDALKFVAPIAASVGSSFAETNSALGLLSNAGLKASLAGTGLKRILSELEGPTTATRRILESLGIAANEVQVSQVGLTQALQTLKDAGVDAGLALEIFGDRGGPAFEVLANQLPALNQLTGVLERSGGAAKRTADDIDNNLNGALLRARASVQGFVLALGEAGANNALTKLFDTAASAFQFASRNIEVFSNLAVGLSSLLSVKLIPQIAKLAASIGLTNPLFLASAAAITAVSAAIGAIEKDVNAVSEAFKQLEEDAKFAQAGSQIRTFQQELNSLNKRISENGAGTESLQKRAAFLRAEIDRLKGSIRQQADDYKRVAAARDLDKASVENTLKALDREIARRKAFTRETQVQIDLEEKVNALLKEGVAPNSNDIQQIENRLLNIQLLQDQRSVLEQIKGPQEQAARQIEALNVLYAQGSITLEEYNAFLSTLKNNTERAVGADPFAAQVASLQDAIELERTRAQQGELVAQTLQIEQDLRREGVEVTAEQRGQLLSLLEAQRALTAETARQAEIDQLGKSLSFKQQAVEEEMKLQELLRQQPQLQSNISSAIDQVRLRGLMASNDLGDGFTRAFLRMKIEAENLAAVGDSIVNAFADRASDAILEFTRTGEFAFKEFASAILEDITRILIRLLIVQAISAALGGGLGAPVAATTNSLMAPGAYGPQLPDARASGGPVMSGHSYIVGENGPELFEPGRSGRIVPNESVSASPAVNVQVVNVDDPNAVPAAVNKGGSDEAIVNVLARNRDRVKQLLG